MATVRLFGFTAVNLLFVRNAPLSPFSSHAPQDTYILPVWSNNEAGNDNKIIAVYVSLEAVCSM